MTSDPFKHKYDRSKYVTMKSASVKLYKISDVESLKKSIKLLRRALVKIRKHKCLSGHGSAYVYIRPICDQALAKTKPKGDVI